MKLVSLSLLTLLALIFPVLSPAQSTFSCPYGYEDMLNYYVMAYPARVDHYMGPGNANPIYSSISPELDSTSFAPTGYVVQTKSAVGYPWDVKTYDKQYVYDRTTELSWTDPTTFKRFVKDLPMTQRCVFSWGPGATIEIPASNTYYQSFSQCSVTQTQPLGYVVNSTSAPFSARLPNLGYIQARTFTYQYTCNQNYASCQYKEVYSLGRGIGVYDWKYYVSKNGQFVLSAESVINNEDVGQVTPILPCPNSYQ